MLYRCGSRIWLRGGPQVLRPKVCDIAQHSRTSKASNFAAGVQGPLKGPGSFWVFNAQICILPHSRDYFSLISISTSIQHLFQHQKLIKIEHYIVLQSIWDILIYYTYYLNLHEKVMLWLNDLRRYAKQSEAEKFYDMGWWKIDQLCDW